MAEFVILAAGGSAVVHENLANADKAEGMPHAGTTAPGGTPHGEEHAAPSVLGLNGAGWVSLAMLVFIGILIWKKVPSVITGALDRQIAGIKQQLDDATALREEAEALRDDYRRRIAAAESSAADMIAHAEAEAQALIAKANSDAAELVGRRATMAEDKIAAAERAALAEVRAKTANAAARAAATLIAARHGADADKALVDRTIAGLGRPN